MHNSGRPLPGTVISDALPSQPRSALPSLTETSFHTDSHDADFVSPLYLAVRNGDINAATALLEQGAEPNVQDKLGMTPLHWTGLKGQLELARLLLFYEASIHIREHFSGGVTPVGMAQLLGYEDVAHLMENWPC